MPTLAQINANQANAKHSTGPVTPEGKARVARNAIRHGLTAKQLVVNDDEQEEFETLQQSLLDELAPQGATETIVFHELVHAAWNLHRFRRIEVELASHAYEEIYSARHAAAADRLNRYQARAQRSYYRALQELRTLQTNRALREAQSAPLPAAEAPALADIAKLTKQTQSSSPAPLTPQSITSYDTTGNVISHEPMDQAGIETVSPRVA